MLVVAEQQRRLAVEDDEDLLLGRMAVRRCVELSRLDHLGVEAGALRAGRLAEEAGDAAHVAPTSLLRLGILDVDDVRRAWTRLGPLELGLGVEGMRDLTGFGPRGIQPVAVRVREVRARRPHAMAVCEHLEPVVPGAKRVRLRHRPMDDAVALPDLVGGAVLPGEPGAAEDVEDLFLDRMYVRRRRNVARVQLDAAHADPDRAGGTAEVGPPSAEVSVRVEARLD